MKTSDGKQNFFWEVKMKQSDKIDVFLTILKNSLNILKN